MIDHEKAYTNLEKRGDGLLSSIQKRLKGTFKQSAKENEATLEQILGNSADRQKRDFCYAGMPTIQGSVVIWKASPIPPLWKLFFVL